MVKDLLHRCARVAGIAALLLGMAVGARAQDDVAPLGDVVSIERRPGYVDAVVQIAKGEESAGLAVLARLAMEWKDDPDLFLLHFNAGCGHARLKQLNEAFAELEQAVAGGYGVHPGRLANLAADPDLENLRADARFAALLQKAESLSVAIAASRKELIAPYEFVPPPCADAAEAKKPLPLLLVFHPYGEERAEFARRLYEPFCTAHRFALLAMSGRQIIGPERFAYFAGGGDFADGFRAEQRHAVIALGEMKKRVAIDPQRIYVSGFGQGAGLGFAVAMRNPQWVRGAVLFDGGYAPASLRDWSDAAVSWGRRVALVHPESDPRYPLAPLESYFAQLESQGFALQLLTVPGNAAPTGTSVAESLAARLAWIDEVPFQRPAADGR